MVIFAVALTNIKSLFNCIVNVERFIGCYLLATIQGGPKNRGHSTFFQISRKLQNIIIRFFAHVKASVY